MIAKVFLGCIMILCFITIYPFFMELWTTKGTGFNAMMATTNMTPMETSFWGFFPLIFLILGCGGIAWLMVRDKDR